MIRVQTEDFDIGAEIGRMTMGNTEIGGVASFVGLVRDYAGDDKISAMTLEHYPGMTEKQLQRLEEKARERWALQEVLIIHRYGELMPGDRIVLVVTASEHREASFESCRFLMDWLKTEAPFWKLEHRESGSRWVNSRKEDSVAANSWTVVADSGEGKR
jgi:molybdopterin synthase catalytic subunit